MRPQSIDRNVIGCDSYNSRKDIGGLFDVTASPVNFSDYLEDSAVYITLVSRQ